MLDYLLSVGGFSVLSLLAIVWLSVRPRAAAPRRWLAAIVIFYTVASIRVFPWVLSRPLLFGFHQFSAGDVPGDRTAIVLLGSGSFTVRGHDEQMGVIDPAGAAHVLEAVHVYHVLGSPWIISSGGATGGFQTVPSVSSFVMVLTLPSTGSCGHRAAEDGRWGAAAQAIAAMRPLVVVELQEAIEGALERAPAGEVVSPKRDAPVLVQDRFLDPLHEAVGPGVTRLRARDADPKALAADREDALEFLAVVGSEMAWPEIAACLLLLGCVAIGEGRQERHEGKLLPVIQSKVPHLGCVDVVGHFWQRPSRAGNVPRVVEVND